MYPKNLVLEKYPLHFGRSFHFWKKKVGQLHQNSFSYTHLPLPTNLRKSIKLQNFGLGVLNVPKKLSPRKWPPSFLPKFSFLKKKSWPTSPKLFPQRRFWTFLKFSKIDQNSKIRHGSTQCTQKSLPSKRTFFILAESFIFQKKKFVRTKGR